VLLPPDELLLDGDKDTVSIAALGAPRRIGLEVEALE
jgi:hypothetical protein